MALELRGRLAEVAELVSRGHSYKEIAEMACITPLTVKAYIEDIAEKIQSDLPAKARVMVWWRLTHNKSIFTGAPLERQ